MTLDVQCAAVLLALRALQRAGGASRGGGWSAGRVAGWLSEESGFAVAAEALLEALNELATRDLVRRDSGEAGGGATALAYALQVRCVEATGSNAGAHPLRSPQASAIWRRCRATPCVTIVPQRPWRAGRRTRLHPLHRWGAISELTPRRCAEECMASQAAASRPTFV
jgi:hypothetical protein